MSTVDCNLHIMVAASENVLFFLLARCLPKPPKNRHFLELVQVQFTVFCCYGNEGTQKANLKKIL